MHEGRMLEIYFGDNTTVCIIKLKGKPINVSKGQEKACFLHDVKIINGDFEDMIITPVGVPAHPLYGRDVNQYVTSPNTWITSEEVLKLYPEFFNKND